jgi:hypothetical protein
MAIRPSIGLVAYLRTEPVAREMSRRLKVESPIDCTVRVHANQQSRAWEYSGSCDYFPTDGS